MEKEGQVPCDVSKGDGRILEKRLTVVLPYLLDGTAHWVVAAVAHWLQTPCTLTTLSRVTLASHGVHGKGQGGVCLQRDGPVGHGTCATS